MKLFSAAVFFFFISSISFAQTGRDVNGLVQDTTGAGILGVAVKLFPASGSGDTLTVRTIANGSYIFKNVKISQFIVSATSLGYSSGSVRSINTNGTSPITVNKIILRPGSTLLSEVVINGAPAVTIKEDTIEYRASDLKLRKDAVVEDAIKRLDGAEVDKDGNVTASGKAVTRIKVDGKEMFGGDMKTATKNIPMDAIDKIQIIDDYGDQASFTGVKDGDPETIINITTKPGKNHGVIFNSAAGGGTEDRYQFGLFASQFEGDRNLGITANLNNNGTQVGGGGFGGRGGGGMNFGANGGGSSGITTLSSIGLNYNDRWSPKMLVSGGYFFTNSDRSALSILNKLSANSTGRLYTNENSNLGTLTNAHSLNARIQYNINRTNQLIITPFVSFSNTRNNNQRITSTFQRGETNTNQSTDATSKSTTPSLSGGVLYNHVFKKPGRNYSLNLNVRDNGLNSDQINNILIHKYDEVIDSLQQNVLADSINYLLNSAVNGTFSGSSRFIYSEPLNKRSRLQFSYNLNYSDYNNDKVVNSQIAGGPMSRVDSLSNLFKYSFMSQQAGVSYNYKNPKNDLSLGLTINPTALNGTSSNLNTTIKRTNFYLMPIIRYQYKYSKTRSMMINYFGNVLEPLFSQLQPVRDISNSQRHIIGNPNLSSTFTHAVNANYNTSNRAKHTSLLITATGNLISNQIVQNILQVPDQFGKTRQEVHYVNTNGYFMYFINYNWQKSFKDRQYTLRLNGDARITENPSFNENARYFVDRTNVTQRVSMDINPGTWLEFSPRFVYVITSTHNKLPTGVDTKIQTYSASVDSRVFFLKSRTLIVGFNANKTYNTGYTGDLSTNPLIINSYIEKQFLKNHAGTLRLQGFDLLNQSNNLIQTITDNGYTNSQTNRLTQYFMMSFTVKINKFAGINPAAREGQNGPERGQPGGNPGGGRQGGLGPGFGN